MLSLAPAVIFSSHYPSCIGPAAPNLHFTNQLPLFSPTRLSPLVFLLLTCCPLLPPKIDDSSPQGEWACLKMHKVMRPTLFLFLLLLLLPLPSPPPPLEASCRSSASATPPDHADTYCPKPPNVVLGTAKLWRSAGGQLDKWCCRATVTHKWTKRRKIEEKKTQPSSMWRYISWKPIKKFWQKSREGNAWVSQRRWVKERFRNKALSVLFVSP